MSFTNAELLRIERDNQLLLQKIMSQQKSQSKPTKTLSTVQRPSNSAINRSRQQKKIDAENMILLRKIQQAKSCAMRQTMVSGCRSTHL